MLKDKTDSKQKKGLSVTLHLIRVFKDKIDLEGFNKCIIINLALIILDLYNWLKEVNITN